MSTPQPLLIDAMPQFVSELLSALSASDHSSLSSHVQSLRIVDRCDCGDGSCATFFTSPKPSPSWGKGHRNIVLPVEGYDLILDVVEQDIVCVEILDRADLKELLDKSFRPCQAT